MGGGGGGDFFLHATFEREEKECLPNLAQFQQHKNEVSVERHPPTPTSWKCTYQLLDFPLHIISRPLGH